MPTELEIRDLDAECTVVSSLANVFLQSGQLGKVEIIRIYDIIYTYFDLILFVNNIILYDHKHVIQADYVVLKIRIT